MNKTTIEWADYTWNPVTGCLNNCEYCYARRIAERFNGTKAWPYGFRPTYNPERIDEPSKLQVPSKIFVCSMAELFGDWIDDKVIEDILFTVYNNPQHTFQFLTKFPQNLARWNPWPNNAWVGASATNTYQFFRGLYGLAEANVGVRFLSFEPLHEYIPLAGIISFLSWLIIGAETGNRRGKPPIERVQEYAKGIIEEADRVGTPVFLKDNLQWPGGERREWPEEAEVASRI